MNDCKINKKLKKIRTRHIWFQMCPLFNILFQRINSEYFHMNNILLLIKTFRILNNKLDVSKNRSVY